MSSLEKHKKLCRAQLSSLPPSPFMVLRFRLIIFSAEFLRMLGTDHQLDSPINSLRWEINWGHSIFFRWEIIWVHRIFLRWKITWDHMNFFEVGNYLRPCQNLCMWKIAPYFLHSVYTWFPPNSNKSHFRSSDWQEIVVLDCYLHFPTLSLQLRLWP